MTYSHLSFRFVGFIMLIHLTEFIFVSVGPAGWKYNLMTAKSSELAGLSAVIFFDSKPGKASHCFQDIDLKVC
jgi:hypothetical protein